MKKLKLVLFIVAGLSMLSACANQTTDQKSSAASTVEESTAPETTVEESTALETTAPESTLAETIIAETTSETISVDSSEIADKHETEPVEPETNFKDDISFEVESVIRNSTSQTSVSITSISINENLGTDEENDFVVLAYLSFDVKNKPKTTKEMLNLLNNEIGVNMAEIDNISELTIFWEVPYLNSSHDNVAKANLLRNDKGFYFEEEWYNSSIFN